MGKRYKKNIAVFLIGLIATMPFYVASVFAQNQPFESSGFGDPVQSCILKAEEGKDLVEALDSGPIKTLEGIVSTLHFTCTAWATVDIAIDTYISVTGTWDNCIIVAVPGGGTTCATNSKQLIGRSTLVQYMDTMCSIAE